VRDELTQNSIPPMIASTQSASYDGSWCAVKEEKVVEKYREQVAAGEKRAALASA